MVRAGSRPVALLLALAACTRGEGTSDTAVVFSAAAAPAQSPPIKTDSSRRESSGTNTTCPEWGQWQLCSVEYRLLRAGLVIQKKPDVVRRSFMHVPGVTYEATSAEIEVYVYPSADARARDTDRLDSLNVAPPGERVVWKDPPTLVVSNNLAAIILSPRERQAERIALALGAGMPLQPPRRP